MPARRSLLVVTALAFTACSSRPAVEPNGPPPKNPLAGAATSIAKTATPDAPPPPPPPRLQCAAGATVAAQWEYAAGANVESYYCTSSEGEHDGPFLTLHPSGATAITGEFHANVLHGPWHRYAPNGTEVEAGIYKDGNKDSTWQQWSATGTLLGSYVMNQGTGIERLWNDDGRVWRERTLLAGVADGPSSLFGSNGVALISEVFKHGLLEGPRSAGDKNVLRVEDKWHEGVRTGDRKMWRRGILWQQDGFDSKGRHHGKFRFWRDRKTFRDTGTYAHGHRASEWKWFDNSGNVERVGSYLDGRRDGLWREMTDNRTTWVGEYKAGKANGTFTYYDYRGNTIGSFEMKNGTGTMLNFFSNKKIDTKIDFVDGKMDGLYQELSLQGKVLVEGHYRSGKKHGAWVEKTAAGAWILASEYTHGKLSGEYRKYLQGKLAVKAHYGAGKQAGQRQGEYLEYVGDTVTLRGQFVAAEKDGIWSTFDEAGAPTTSATWDAGRLEGAWQSFASGKLAVSGNYHNGMRVGTWQWFDGNGTIVREAIYKTP